MCHYYYGKVTVCWVFCVLLHRYQWRTLSESWSVPSVKSSSLIRSSCPVNTAYVTNVSKIFSCPTTMTRSAQTPGQRARTRAALDPESRLPVWRNWTDWCAQVTRHHFAWTRAHHVWVKTDSIQHSSVCVVKIALYSLEDECFVINV